MYGRLQKAVDRLNNVVQEGLTAIRAVKAFVRGEYEEGKGGRVHPLRLQIGRVRITVLAGIPHFLATSCSRIGPLPRAITSTI